MPKCHLNTKYTYNKNKTVKTLFILKKIMLNEAVIQ